jgi:plasmid stabilization system protein ParE
MEYLVRLTDRALRDLEAIYEFIQAESSDRALAWFNELNEAIYSLGRFPERGRVVPELGRLRQLLFGKQPGSYRIIYSVDRRNRAVNILHIRHSARDRS